VLDQIPLQQALLDLVVLDPVFGVQILGLVVQRLP
jgi:hypothetical protein